MRVLIAPDCFGSVLTSAEAARLLAQGWAAGDPATEADLAPLSDGGPGFLDALALAVGGERRVVEVTGPLGSRVEAELLLAGATAYVESAQAVGLHLTARRDPERASSYGVGELLVAAREAGAVEVVVGVGGTATNDGGRGLVEALGPGGLSGLDVRVATDVDNPLLGLTGATAVFGPQKGADPSMVQRLEVRMEQWADELERRAGRGFRELPGAGAGGGIGFALLALGAARVPGAGLVLEAVGLAERVARADLVVTGEGSFDHQSLRGKVAAAVAGLAAEHAVPVVVVAGQVSVGQREAAAHGITETWSCSDLAGSVGASLAEPGRWLVATAERAARSWAR